MVAQHLRPRLSAVVRHDNLILAILAVGIGVAVGWTIIGFREVIDVVQSVFFGRGGEDLATIAAALPRWQAIAALTFGGLLLGLFYRYLMRGRDPLGPVFCSARRSVPGSVSGLGLDGPRHVFFSAVAVSLPWRDH